MTRQLLTQFQKVPSQKWTFQQQHKMAKDKKMNIIYQEPYSFILIEEANQCYITYFTGGPVELDICVKLTPDEAKLAAISKEETLKLVEKFKSDRNLMLARRIIPSIRPKRS